MNFPLSRSSYFYKIFTSSILSFALLSIVSPTKNQAQVIQDFEIEIEAINVPDVPGIHSFAFGVDSLGRWLVLGGRIDGLHQRQPFAAFLESDNNKNAFVIDPNTEEVWSVSLSILPSPLFEQLQSTNMEFFQRENQLYIIGGYGYSATISDHITYSYLTAVDVNELTNAIVSSSSILPYFRQVANNKMAVTGGYLGYLDSVFYLAGGQYFEGRYNPMGPNNGPGFIQEYTEAIRKFKIEDDGTNLTITNFTETVDAANLHRRDYNMAPQFFPNGEQGFTMFSGVFQHNEDLPFLNSVDITSSGYTVNNTFNQYLSQYHTAHIPILDKENNVMHTVFFGGMSQYTLDGNGNLVEDENVPFVKTISRVSRFSNGEMEEVKLNIEMPTFVGSGAEFIPHPDAPFVATEVLILDDITEQKTHIGYIYGGIQSSEENIFFINDGSQSFASNVIFKVFITKKSTSTNELTVNSGNVFKINVYPSPADNEITIEYFNPSTGKVNMELLDVNGVNVTTIFQGLVSEGKQKLIFEMPDLADGMYFISVENKIQKNVKTIFLK